MTPGEMWMKSAGFLAVEIVCLFVLAYIAHRFVKAAVWRKVIWQTFFVASLLVGVTELTGVSRGMAAWLATPAVTEVRIEAPIRAETMSMNAGVVPAIEPATEPATPTLAYEDPATFVPIQQPLPAVTPATSAAPEWPSWLGWLWAIGIVILVGRTAMARLCLFIFCWRSSPMDSAELNKIVRDVAARLGLRRRIRLLEWRSLKTPIAFGILRPTIGLPKNFRTEFSAAQQEAMLTHEAAHLAAGDPFWHMVSDFTAAVFWWHPMTWWARRCLHEASEIAADEATSIVENGPATLAECLVSVGRDLIAARSFGWLGIDGGFRSGLGRRVERLLNLTSNLHRPSRWKILTTRIAITCIVLVGASLGAGWVESDNARAGQGFRSEIESGWKDSFVGQTIYAWNTRGKKTFDPGDTVPLVRTPPPATRNFVDVTLTTNLETFPIAFTNSFIVPAQRPELRTEDSLFYLTNPKKLAARVPAFTENPNLPRPKSYATDEGFFFALPPRSITPQATTFPEVASLNRAFVAQDPLRELRDRNTIPPANLPVYKMTPTPDGPSAYRTFEKLDSIKIPKLGFQGESLDTVLNYIASETKRLDPESMGVAILSIVTNELKVKIDPPLTNLSVGSALDAVVAVAEKKITYSVDKKGLVEFRDAFRSAPTATLITRTFKVDALRFIAGLQANGFATEDESAAQFAIPAVGIAPDTQVFAVSKTNQITANLNEAVRRYLKLHGIFLEPPKNLFFNNRNGSLLVRATEADCAAIEPLLAKLQTPPQPSAKTNVATNDSSELFTRTFKVDPNVFTAGLAAMDGEWSKEKDPQKRSKAVNEAVRSYFTQAGVSLDAPKSVFFNDRNGLLLVRGSAHDLEIVESAIRILNEQPPQITIEAKFVEITETDVKALGFDWFLGDTIVNITNAGGTVQVPHPVSARVAHPNLGKVPANVTNDVVANVSGILTDSQYRVVVRALEQRSGADVLSAPKVTTLSGRQAQVSVTDVRTIVTGLNTVKGANGSSTNTLETTQWPFGPTLDVIPYVSADGYTLQLTIIATVTEFLGYEKPDDKLQKATGTKTTLPLPRLRLRQAVTSANVFDGQTVVLGGMLTPADEKSTRRGAAKNPRKNLLVFVTARMTDPAGNPVHTYEEIPNKVPAQPAK